MKAALEAGCAPRQPRSAVPTVSVPGPLHGPAPEALLLLFKCEMSIPTTVSIRKPFRKDAPGCEQRVVYGVPVLC